MSALAAGLSGRRSTRTRCPRRACSWSGGEPPPTRPRREPTSCRDSTQPPSPRLARCWPAPARAARRTTRSPSTSRPAMRSRMRGPRGWCMTAPWPREPGPASLRRARPSDLYPAGDAKPGRLDEAAVDVDATVRSSRRRVGPQRRPLLIDRAQVGIVVARHVQQGHVEAADDVLEIVGGQVPAAEDDIGCEPDELVAVQALVDLVRDREDAHWD